MGNIVFYYVINDDIYYCYYDNEIVFGRILMASMNKAIKEQWITALRSGEYKQGKEYLNNKGFCCLGVLTDIGVKNNIGEQSNDSYSDINRFVPYDDSGNSLINESSISILSVYITEWAEMKNFRLLSTGEFDDISLVTMNDSGDKSFNEIADFIEKHIEGV